MKRIKFCPYCQFPMVTKGFDGMESYSCLNPKCESNAGSGLEQVISWEEYIDLMDDPETYEVPTHFMKNGVSTSIKSGLINSGLSVIKNSYAYKKGDKTAKEAGIDLAIDAGSSLAKGAATRLVKKVSTEMAKRSGSSFVRGIFRSNALTTVAIGGVGVATDAVRFANGRIGKDEFLDRTGNTAITGACGYGGTGICALIGTAIAPGPGTVIGAASGGIMSSFVGSSLYKKLKSLF